MRSREDIVKDTEKLYKQATKVSNDYHVSDARNVAINFGILECVLDIRDILDKRMAAD